MPLSPDDIPRLPEELANLQAQAEAQKKIEQRERQARRARRARVAVRVIAVVVLTAAAAVGAYLFVTRDSGETVAPPTAAQEAREVLNESITRSTDGIVALLDNGDVVTMSEDGTNRRVVLEAPADAVPVRRAEGLAGFRSPPTLAMAPSGSAVYVARPYEGAEPCPAGSPYEPTNGRITRVPLDGSPPRDVVDGLGPAVSPDGRYLVYITNGTCDEAPAVVVSDILGDEPDRVFRDPDRTPVYQPVWLANGQTLLIDLVAEPSCEGCQERVVAALDVFEAESLADATPAVPADDGCEQWPMVAAGDDVVTTRNSNCDISAGFLSVTDAETEATSSLDPGTPPASILVDLNTEGGRLLLVEYDAATDTSRLVAWSPDAGRVELGDGIAAGVWILNEDGAA
ncbi:MAG: hypothetical protein R3A49_13085 [Acidimicrobiia bacterium]